MEIHAWEAFLLAYAAATRALEREAGGPAALLLSELHLLVQLARVPDPGMRPTDLAKISLTTKSGLTRTVDRLLADGLVERRVCQTDARSHYVALTPKGRRAVVRAAPGQLRAIAAHFSDLMSPREREVVTTVMERIAAAE